MQVITFSLHKSSDAVTLITVGLKHIVCIENYIYVLGG